MGEQPQEGMSVVAQKFNRERAKQELWGWCLTGIASVALLLWIWCFYQNWWLAAIPAFGSAEQHLAALHILWRKYIIAGGVLVASWLVGLYLIIVGRSSALWGKDRRVREYRFGRRRSLREYRSDRQCSPM